MTDLLYYFFMDKFGRCRLLCENAVPVWISFTALTNVKNHDQNNTTSPSFPHLGGGDQLVKDVVVPLLGALEGDAGLLEEVVLHHASLDVPRVVKAHLHELTEPTRVVIPHRLGVTCYGGRMSE